MQEVSFILTYECTYSCSMCLQRKPFRDEFVKQFPSTMTLENWCSVVDQLEVYRKDIQYIYITGGEPFLKPYIFDLIRYIKNKHYICFVNSNGSLLKDRIDELLDSGLDTLILSIDGTEKSHDVIRNCEGSYDNVVSVIKEIRRKRKWLKPRIFVNCTIQENNIDQLLDWTNEMTEVGADYLYFHLHMFISEATGNLYCQQYRNRFGIEPFSYKGAVANPSVDVEKLLKTLDEIKKTHNNISMLHNLQKTNLDTYYNYPDKIFRQPAMRTCYAPENIFEVVPDGSVITCHDFPDYVVGNVKEQSVEGIWEGDKLNKFRRMLRDQKLLAICHRCCMSERYADYDNGAIKQKGAFHEETSEV